MFRDLSESCIIVPSGQDNKLKQKDKAFLLAVCVGDGYLTKPNSSGRVNLVLQHSVAQEPYLQWKRDRIAAMVDGPSSNLTHFTSNGYPAVKWSKQHPYCSTLRTWLYKDNRKVISAKIVNKLTVEGLAVVWMDDGSMYAKKHPVTKKAKALEGILSLYGTLHEATQLAVALNNKFATQFKVVKHRDQYRLRLNTAGCKHLSSIIYSFMCPAMSYKIALALDSELQLPLVA